MLSTNCLIQWESISTMMQLLAQANKLLLQTMKRLCFQQCKATQKCIQISLQKRQKNYLVYKSLTGHGVSGRMAPT